MCQDLLFYHVQEQIVSTALFKRWPTMTQKLEEAGLTSVWDGVNLRVGAAF